MQKRIACDSISKSRNAFFALLDIKEKGSFIENVKLLLHGGHEVDAGDIAIFEFLVCLGCLFMYIVLNHYSKKYESTTIKAELYMWKLDIVSSIGVAVAFAVQMILLRTPLSFLTPFIDPPEAKAQI